MLSAFCLLRARQLLCFGSFCHDGFDLAVLLVLVCETEACVLAFLDLFMKFPLADQLLFVFKQLPLETGVRENNAAARLDQTHGLKHVELMLCHQVCDHHGCTAGDACVAVDKNCAAVLSGLFNKAVASCKVLAEILPGHVHHMNHFVVEISGETRVQPTEYLKYVRDALRGYCLATYMLF